VDRLTTSVGYGFHNHGIGGHGGLIPGPNILRCMRANSRLSFLDVPKLMGHPILALYKSAANTSERITGLFVILNIRYPPCLAFTQPINRPSN
jgi:hypothetical protein